jgi:polar amino acid transport system permease protein
MTARPGAQPIVKLVLEVVTGLLLVTFVCALFWWVLVNLDQKFEWERMWEYRTHLLEGWRSTLWISLIALPGSCLVAGLLVAGSRAPLHVVRWFTRGFVELVRGMPLLTLVLIGYYVVFAQQSVSELFHLDGPQGKVAAGIALLSIFTAAYLSEILRGGLDSIPQGQIDSARAVGFNRVQVFRYVIFPQALRRVLPALAGQFVTLVKDSSLLSVIGIMEFTYGARTYNSATYGGIEGFVMLGIGYLLITIPIAGFAHWLERRFQYTM